MKNVKNISFRIIVVLVIALFCSYHIYYYCLDKFNNKIVNNYIVETNIKDSHNIVKEDKKSEENNYLGILEIPKINLKQPIFSINNSNNNVNKHIEILKESTMPDKINSVLILAAHSGNSYLGYFNDLDKLVINDKAYIYYQNKKYEYIVDNIKVMDKNGVISFNKSSNSNYLILTTCVKNEDKQLVVISKLLKKY